MESIYYSAAILSLKIFSGLHFPKGQKLYEHININIECVIAALTERLD